MTENHTIDAANLDKYVFGDFSVTREHKLTINSVRYDVVTRFVFDDVRLDTIVEKALSETKTRNAQDVVRQKLADCSDDEIAELLSNEQVFYMTELERRKTREKDPVKVVKREVAKMSAEQKAALLAELQNS